MGTSVVLYGAAIATLRDWKEALVQPAAALRTGESVPVCGVFLAETGDRLYLARIDRDKPELAGNSSHVFWLSRKDTIGWAVGSAQSKPDADRAIARLSRRTIAERRAGRKVTVTRNTTTPAPATGPPRTTTTSGPSTPTKITVTKDERTAATTKTPAPPPCSIYATP